MIKTIVFDLGGVIFAQSFEGAIRHFEEIGVKDARKILDPFTQLGFFGDLESGKITAEEFKRQLSVYAGHDVTDEECKYACTGFVSHVPQRNLDALRRLRSEGYRLLLLSNTNPFMMMWAMSPEFDGKGHSLRDYFDACYLSYECRLVKPLKEIFQMVLEREGIKAEETLFIDDSERNVSAAQALGIQTICPKDNADWTNDVFRMTGIPYIRHATTADIGTIMKLIDEGRQKMIAQGNTKQWSKGHPSQEVIEQDIAKGNSYLICNGDEVLATFALVEGPDPTYVEIYNGQWLNDKTYFVVHRAASSPKAHGVMRTILNYSFQHTDTLRIDTHEDNKTMQALLKKNGFNYCGIIHLENGDPRLAFQKTLCPQFKLIIFDFDGTLGDTRGIVVTTMQQTLQEFLLRQAAEAERGQTMRSDEECAATIGLPLSGCFRQLIPEATDEVIQQCVDTYHRLFEINKDRIKPQAFPHVKETLEKLHRQGIRMTVATSRGIDSLKDLLTDMGIIQYFDYLLGADGVAKHKPDPEPVLQTLRTVHIDASQTLVVGDMPVDILMGSRAGCKTCAVTYGNATREELEEAGADYIIDDFHDLLHATIIHL